MAKTTKTKVNEETPAQDSIKAHPVPRVDMINHAVGYLSGLNAEDLTAFFEKMLGGIGKEGAGVPDGASGKNQASIAAKGDAKAAYKEDLQTVFAGQELSEEVLERTITLFEAVVSGRVALERVELEEAFKVQLAERAKEIEGKVDQYITYASKEWMKENTVSVTNSIKTRMVEGFITELKELLVRHNVDVPDEQVEVVTKLTDRVEELEDKLNAAVEENLQTQHQRDALIAERTFTEAAAGLTVVDAEKFRTLSESIDFTGDVEDLKGKLKTIREAHFKADGSAALPKNKDNDGTGATLGEEVVVLDVTEGKKPGVPGEPPSDEMKRYTEHLRRTADSAHIFG